MLEIALYLISLIGLATLGMLTAFRLTSNPLLYRTQFSSSSQKLNSMKSSNSFQGLTKVSNSFDFEENPISDEVSERHSEMVEEINIDSFGSKGSEALKDAESLEKCRKTIHRVNLQVLLGRYRMGMPVNGAVFPGETHRRTYSVGSADYLPNKEKLLLRQAGDYKWDEAAGKF